MRDPFREFSAALRRFRRDAKRASRRLRRFGQSWPNPGRDVVRSQRQRRRK